MPSKKACRLCGEIAPLRKSHIFPKFFITKMKHEGGGLMRQPSAPNRPFQDGPKPRLLCGNCEQMFGRSEAVFASSFFHPWIDRNELPRSYGGELHYFLVSLLWRGLAIELDHFKQEHGQWKPKLHELEEDFRDYLLGQKQVPSNDRIHMFVASADGAQKQPIPNFNRYMTGVAEFTTGHSKSRCWVHFKLGMFLVLGAVSELEDEHWTNTRIHQQGGAFKLPQVISDPEYGAFLTDRARMGHQLYTSRISDEQVSRTHARLMGNADQLFRGVLGRAIAADITATVDPTMGRTSKIGRNEACPCGSGKKYKMCHG